eukprot:CAMPEP_0119156290 /NCGR_PEP_ID=MMETSP1310-20130426/52183_1 /TAXON_ID=464262 /ORGANISM="Genus nov. species nov., Strain RCC2339" /LENGTH=389 /DNA_ID=CAMNT_0007148901 /DNA_START=339 /DNA_END=1508 /DNA_ORIENTATION=-
MDQDKLPWWALLGDKLYGYVLARAFNVSTPTVYAVLYSSGFPDADRLWWEKHVKIHVHSVLQMSKSIFVAKASGESGSRGVYIVSKSGVVEIHPVVKAHPVTSLDGFIVRVASYLAGTFVSRKVMVRQPWQVDRKHRAYIFEEYISTTDRKGYVTNHNIFTVAGVPMGAQIRRQPAVLADQENGAMEERPRAVGDGEGQQEEEPSDGLCLSSYSIDFAERLDQDGCRVPADVRVKTLFTDPLLCKGVQMGKFHRCEGGEKPQGWDYMLEKSREMSAAVGTFLRVDWFVTGRGPVLNEFAINVGGGRLICFSASRATPALLAPGARARYDANPAPPWCDMGRVWDAVIPSDTEDNFFSSVTVRPLYPVPPVFSLALDHGRVYRVFLEQHR